MERSHRVDGGRMVPAGEMTNAGQGMMWKYDMGESRWEGDAR